MVSRNLRHPEASGSTRLAGLTRRRSGAESTTTSPAVAVAIPCLLAGSVPLPEAVFPHRSWRFRVSRTASQLRATELEPANRNGNSTERQNPSEPRAPKRTTRQLATKTHDNSLFFSFSAVHAVLRPLRPLCSPLRQILGFRSSVVPSIIRLPKDRHIRRMPRRDLLVGIDPVDGLVHRGRRLREA